MRITSLEIENFRAIRKLQVSDLGDVVVIAGPNGCGKSCILDAIRLLKSAYGGYQANELQQWFGEFQIKLAQRATEAIVLFQDPNRPLRLAFEIDLHPSEHQVLHEQAEKLIREFMWNKARAPTPPGIPLTISVADEHFVKSSQIEREAPREAEAVRKELAQKLIGTLEINPDGTTKSHPSHVLPLIFSVYRPQEIGVIDYHGAQRNYAREQVGGHQSQH